MIRNLSILFYLFIFPTVMFGQAAGYDFSSTVTSYSPIVGGTRYTAIESDAGSVRLALPFSFYFENQPYDSITVGSDGYISFNKNSTANSMFMNGLSTIGKIHRPLLAPLWDDLDGRAPRPDSSTFYIATTGSKPSRVTTIEWRNWEWNYYSNSDVISFQVKLYETTNVVEFVYQQESNPPSNGSASIGIAGKSTYLSLASTSTSPIVSSNFEATNLNSRPTTGQVYRFTPPDCFAPESVTQTNATATEIELEWTGTGNNWQVEYGPVGHLPGSGSMLTTTNQYATITGLSPNHCYAIFVRDSCGPGNTSTWSGPFRVCTSWDAPLLETFDGNLPNLNTEPEWYQFPLENGWSVRSSSQDFIWSWLPHNAIEGPKYDHTSGNGIFMYGESALGELGDTTWLYSPFVNLSNLNRPAVRLWYHKQVVWLPSGLSDIILEIDTNASGNWIVIDDTSMAGQTHNGPATIDPWKELRIPLDGYNGIVRFRLAQIKPSCCEFAAIDDFEVFDQLDNDLIMKRLIRPVDDNCSGTNTTVEVEIVNNGSDSVKSFGIAYQLNGGPIVRELVSQPIPPYKGFIYKFRQSVILKPGPNKINAWTELNNDQYLGNDTLAKTAEIHIAPLLPGNIYHYGFENSNQGWAIGGNNASWDIGLPAPANDFINSPANGRNAAVTNLNGSPNQNEYSYLQSPCFDFSSYENDPILAFALIYENSIYGSDVGFLQMSVNGGQSWKIVGNFGEGTNWYDNTGNTWGFESGPAKNWIQARIPLEGAAGNDAVALRFVYATDGFVRIEGMGIDDVMIVTPPNDLLPDTVSLCRSSSVELNAGGFYPDTMVRYMWSTGDTTPSISAVQPGRYTVTITDKLLQNSTTEHIEVIDSDLPNITFKNEVDTIDFFKLPAKLELNPNLPHSYTYKWTWEQQTTHEPFYIINPSLMGTGLHTVHVTVTDHYGCSNNADHAIFISDFVGIGTLDEGEFSYYPNPVSDYLNILMKSPQPLGKIEVLLINAQGKVDFQATFQDNSGNLNTKINTANMASGMYLLKIENAGKQLSHKLMIR